MLNVNLSKRIKVAKKLKLDYQTANFDERTYLLLYGNNSLGYLEELTREHGISGRILIVSNTKIKKLYGNIVEKAFIESGYIVNWAIFPDGERYKNLETVTRLYDKAAKAKLDKSGAVVALGGGVIQDVSNYLAATYMRGVPFIQIPTTVLSQVDVGIGGCAVDHNAGKSLLGTFYQPKFVLMDSSVFKTLPQKEIINGIAEIINKALCLGGLRVTKINEDIKNIKSGDWQILNEYIKLSNKVKKKIIEQDEIGTSELRLLLDWGHTVTYAIEKITNYSISHGMALGIGMNYAAKISSNLGNLSQKKVADLKLIISNAGLPTELPKNINIDELLSLMNFDQKAKDGKKRFILLNDFGKAFTSDVISDSIIKQSFQ